MRVVTCLALMSVLLTGATCSPSDAQQPQGKQRARYQPPAKARTATVKYQRLEHAPNELPAMSQVAPPGGQYIFGTKSVNEKGMTQVILRYGTSADARSVLSSYAQQFTRQGSGWKLLGNTSTMVQAQFNKNVVNIQILAPSKKNSINDVQLSYVFLEQ